MPPVAQVIILAVSIFLISHLIASPPIPGLLRVLIGIVAGSASGILLYSSIISFRKHATTIDPLDPSKAKTLVTEGVFQITRNPMHVAMALSLMVICMIADSMFGLLAVPLFVMNMTYSQIKLEESVMTKLFGDDYVLYQSETPRWLWRAG